MHPILCTGGKLMFRKKTISAILAAIVLLMVMSTTTRMGANAASGDIAFFNKTLGFSLTIPESWSDYFAFEEDNSVESAKNVAFYSWNNKVAGNGGLLFAITLYDDSVHPDLESDEFMEVLLKIDGKTFCVLYPADPQYDPEDDVLRTEYLSMQDDIADIIKTFHHTSQNADMPFTDVPESEWYYNDVKIAYNFGLINGKTQTTFAPADNLTYAEAVKLAACMHQLATIDAVTLSNASPVWYQSYVDYAKANDIIIKDYSWGSQATRAGYIEIFSNALPDGSLDAINEIPDGAIPDVPMTHPQATAIYTLYRAGILQGVDAAHNCDPSSYIRRREVAAILTRMMFDTERIEFSFERTVISAGEARAILQAWVDSHPFQLGSVLEPESDVYALDGITYYRFELSIIKLGVAQILVNEKTGEMFHLTSPYSSVGFAPIDDWYNLDHEPDAVG